MKYLTLIKRNMSKHLGSFIGIFILMFIISISLSSVLCIAHNSKRYVEQEMDRVHFGDVSYWFYENPKMDQIKETIAAISEVEQVNSMDFVIYNLSCNGKESAAFVFAYRYDAYDTPFYLFQSSFNGYEEKWIPLAKGEVYVPISYKSIFDAKVGDVIQIQKDDRQYVVKGFFEDPTAGSSMMGMKNIIMSDADFEELFAEGKETVLSGKEGPVTSGHLLSVEQKENTGLIQNLQKKIAEVDGVQSGMIMGYTRISNVGFMLLVQNVFDGILLAFVLVLLLVSMIVVGHCISSTIEQSYVDLGILKAIGFTKRDLCLVQSLQYLVILLAGILVGILSSAFFIRAINQIILPVTGILIPTDLPRTLLLCAFAGMLLLFILFILCKVSSIGRISPMTAIRGGKTEVFFASRLQTEIRPRPLQFWIALRQLTSGKKRYIAALIIASLLSFFLTFCMRLYGWLGEDGEGMMNSLGVASVQGRTYNLAVGCSGEISIEELEQKIEEITPIFAKYEIMSGGIHTIPMNGIDYFSTAISNPEYLHMIKGRPCRYENEVVITNVIEEETGIQIGDTVELTFEGNQKSFLVTGINQCANDLGENIVISLEGARFLKEGEVPLQQVYTLEDKKKLDEVVSSLEKNYGDQIEIECNEWTGVDGILKAADILEKLMYGICVIFIMIVIYVTGSKLIYREQHDLGIYKSLGFYSEKLRISFSIRFILVAFLGVALGEVGSTLFTDVIAGSIFSSIGIRSFDSSLDQSSMGITFFVIVAAFGIFSYLLAGRMRKTQPSI